MSKSSDKFRTKKRDQSPYLFHFIKGSAAEAETIRNGGQTCPGGSRRIKDDIFQRQLDERERCFEKLKKDILK